MPGIDPWLAGNLVIESLKADLLRYKVYITKENNITSL
jgi:hypothetical protein